MKVIIILMISQIYALSHYSQNINNDIINTLSSFIEKKTGIESDINSIVFEEILNEEPNQVYLFYSTGTLPPVHYVLIKNKEQYSILNANVKDFISFLIELEEKGNELIFSTESLLKCLKYISESSLRCKPIMSEDKVKDNVIFYEFSYMRDY